MKNKTILSTILIAGMYFMPNNAHSSSLECTSVSFTAALCEVLNHSVIHVLWSVDPSNLGTFEPIINNEDVKFYQSFLCAALQPLSITGGTIQHVKSGTAIADYWFVSTHPPQRGSDSVECRSVLGSLDESINADEEDEECEDCEYVAEEDYFPEPDEEDYWEEDEIEL